MDVRAPTKPDYTALVRVAKRITYLGMLRAK